jgi:transposase
MVFGKWIMPAHFVNIDRATPMLLPPDIRDWIPQNHIAHFILEAVDIIPETAGHINWRGSGSEQYPPRMMLAVLIYGYVTGRFSSREIERATYIDVAMRFLSGDTHPDHDTICTFRRRNEVLFKRAFVSVLETASAMGHLKKVGAVSLDGTKVPANASKHSAVSYEHARRSIAELEMEVGVLMSKAEQADSAPKDDGLDIPAEIERREKRLEALKRARAVIEERARERAAREQPGHERKLQAREARKAAGQRPGREPKPPRDTPEAKDQYNFTDPESRIMKAGTGGHFEQAYNAQGVVDAEGSMLILGAHVSDAPNDKEQLAPGVASVEPGIRQMTAVLVDSGFYSEAAVAQVEALREDGSAGPVVYAAMARESHHRTLEELARPPEPAPLGEGAGIKERMEHRLATAEGRALYKLRKQTVEPVFGIIKEVMGFRRFSLRGQAKASLEWLLVCAAYNVKRLHKMTQNPAKMTFQAA